LWLLHTQGKQSDSRIPSDPIGKSSDCIGSHGNSSEVVGILVTGFLSEVVGCRKVSERLGSGKNRGYSDTFRHPTTSDRNPVTRILSEFVGSDRILWDSFDLGMGTINHKSFTQFTYLWYIYWLVYMGYWWSTTNWKNE